MFFKKKIPEAPPIEDEQQYISWFLEYGDEVKPLRKLFVTDKFVAASTKGAMKMLEDYPTGDELFERIGHLSVAYETQMKPLVAQQGGLPSCSSELQGAAGSILMSILVGKEILEKKFKHPEAIELYEEVRKLT